MLAEQVIRPNVTEINHIGSRSMTPYLGLLSEHG